MDRIRASVLTVGARFQLGQPLELYCSFQLPNLLGVNRHAQIRCRDLHVRYHAYIQTHTHSSILCSFCLFLLFHRVCAFFSVPRYSSLFSYIYPAGCCHRRRNSDHQLSRHFSLMSRAVGNFAYPISPGNRNDSSRGS